MSLFFSSVNYRISENTRKIDQTTIGPIDLFIQLKIFQ